VLHRDAEHRWLRNENEWPSFPLEHASYNTLQQPLLKYLSHQQMARVYPSHHGEGSTGIWKQSCASTSSCSVYACSRHVSVFIFSTTNMAEKSSCACKLYNMAVAWKLGGTRAQIKNSYRLETLNYSVWSGLTSLNSRRGSCPEVGGNVLNVARYP